MRWLATSDYSMSALRKLTWAGQPNAASRTTHDFTLWSCLSPTDPSFRTARRVSPANGARDSEGRVFLPCEGCKTRPLARTSSFFKVEQQKLSPFRQKVESAPPRHAPALSTASVSIVACAACRIPPSASSSPSAFFANCRGMAMQTLRRARRTRSRSTSGWRSSMRSSTRSRKNSGARSRRRYLSSFNKKRPTEHLEHFRALGVQIVAASPGSLHYKARLDAR